MTPIAVITFIGLTGLIAVISWWVTRKEDLSSTEGYFLGGRHLGWFLVGGSLFLSNISAIAIIGETESAYLNNMTIMMFGFSSIVAMVIVSEFIAPIYLRYGVTTSPEFLGLRYDNSVRSWMATLLIISYVVNLMPPVLYTGAVVFNGMFNVDELLGISEWATLWIIIWAIGMVGSAYAIFGGLKAIAASDALNGVGLVLGGLLVPYFGLKYLGDGNLFAGWERIITEKPEHLNSLGKVGDPVPWTTLFTGMLLVNLNYWGAEQYILQRTLGSKNLAAGQKGMMFGATLKFMAPIITVFPGVIALLVLPNLATSAEAYPQLVTAVMPPFLIGIIAAIMFGAALTTFNSGLNSTSTMAVLNLYKPYKEKRGEDLPDRQLIRLGKTTQVILALVAMTLAPFLHLLKGNFIEVFQTIAGLFGVPLFTLILMGMFTKRVPAIGAKFGLLFYIIGYGYTQVIALLKANFKNRLAETDQLEEYDFSSSALFQIPHMEIHFLHAAAIFFIGSCAIMLVFGLIKPQEEVLQRPDKPAVDLTPWKWRVPAYIALIAAMLAVVFWLSPFGIAEW